MTAFCFRESGKVGRLHVEPKEGFTKDAIAEDILRHLRAQVKKDQFIKVIVI